MNVMERRDEDVRDTLREDRIDRSGLADTKLLMFE